MRLLAVLRGVVIGAAVVAGAAQALPFNDDMVDSHLTDGQVTRARPPGTVTKGSLEYRVDTREQAEKLTNPVKGDQASLTRGDRLYRVHCYSCHGNLMKKPWEPGPVGQPGRLPGVPNISDSFYKSRTDGYIYGIIHFGGAGFMPAYGWKLSPQDHWDIINYVRSAQK